MHTETVRWNIFPTPLQRRAINCMPAFLSAWHKTRGWNLGRGSNQDTDQPHHMATSAASKQQSRMRGRRCKHNCIKWVAEANTFTTKSETIRVSQRYQHDRLASNTLVPLEIFITAETRPASTVSSPLHFGIGWSLLHYQRQHNCKRIGTSKFSTHMQDCKIQVMRLMPAK